MRKIILALLVCFFLIGCQQKAPEVQEKITAPEPEALPPEPAVEPEAAEPEAAPEVRPTEPTATADLQSACNKIIPAEEFASICGIDAARITRTAQASEHSCWVSFTDRQAKQYTAGFTTVDWLKADEALSEFDRGITMRRAALEATVGEKNYGFAEISRENIVWLRGTFLTRIGASTQLCTKEKLVELAQAVDSKLQ
jgi:hypothetical protein